MTPVQCYALNLAVSGMQAVCRRARADSQTMATLLANLTASRPLDSQPNRLSLCPYSGCALLAKAVNAVYIYSIRLSASGEPFEQEYRPFRVLQGTLESILGADLFVQRFRQSGQAVVDELHWRAQLLSLVTGEGRFADTGRRGKVGLRIRTAGPAEEFALTSRWKHTSNNAVVAM